MAAAQALLPARLQPAADAGAARRDDSREGLESPWAERLKEWKPDPEHDARITTRVPCGEYFGVRDQALMAHATQIDPDGPFFQIPLEIQREVWPTEDFELVDLLCGQPGARGRPVLGCARRG